MSNAKKRQVILDALDTTDDFVKRQHLLRCLWKLQREAKGSEQHAKKAR